MREKHLCSALSRYKVLRKHIKDLTSLLVGEVALRSSAGEGYRCNDVAVLQNLGIRNTEVPVLISAILSPPHTPLRCDLSHKGRGKEVLRHPSHKERGKEPCVPVFFFFLLDIFAGISSLFAMTTSTLATTPNAVLHSSLFFQEEEIAHIHEDKRDALKFGEIKLFAILYTDDQHWSLWINDKMIHPENMHDLMGVRIKKVTPDEVTFSYISSKNAGVKTFTLRPHPAPEYPLRKRDVTLQQTH